jgi:hypothetical protein
MMRRMSVNHADPVNRYNTEKGIWLWLSLERKLGEIHGRVDIFLGV